MNFDKEDELKPNLSTKRSKSKLDYKDKRTLPDYVPFVSSFSDELTAFIQVLDDNVYEAKNAMNPNKFY